MTTGYPSPPKENDALREMRRLYWGVEGIYV